MISYKQLGSFYLFNDIVEDPENSDEVYFADLSVRIGKLNLRSGQVNNFFSCDLRSDPSYIISVTIDDFFFIDKDRGISGGSSSQNKEFIIHRFIY